VLPLFDPLRSWSLMDMTTPEVLHQPEGGKKQSSVYRVPRPGGHGGTLIHVDTYDESAKVIRYSILYPDVELEKREIRCNANPDGGTTATVREIIVGLNTYGVRAVSEYVQEGGVQRAIESNGEAINRYLREKWAK
jgi:hypothetical protein